jgi:diaminopimelate decarboxylase
VVGNDGGFTMNLELLALQVRERINQLKTEQIGLRSFIQSDQALWEALEKAIQELTWVLNKLEAEED